MSGSRPDTSHTIYRDAVTLVLIGFIAMVIWMLPFLNPPVDADDATPPGNLMASIVWPEGNDDVDLWVIGPGEPVPVGYSNKGGVLWNLLRDDLGSSPDITTLNFEHSFTRGIVPGDYVINVHCYRCRSGSVEVTLEVGIKGGPESKMETIGTSTVTLSKGEEKTALAFSIDGEGKLIEGSMNTLLSPLRNGRK